MARSDDNGKVIPFPGTAGGADSAMASSMEAAALWLARLQGELDAAERVALDGWLRASPGNAQALRDMAAFWGEQDLLADLDLAKPEARRLRFMPARIMRYAAVIVAAIGLGMAGMYLHEPAAESQVLAVVQYEQTFATVLGERSTQTLPDGSIITLNTSTEVHVVYHERDRIVELRRGEAHFAVAHNAARPFGVRAAGHIVQAVGTAFNVRLQQAGTAEVTVTEGIVQILEAGRSAETATEPATDEWWTRPALGDGLVPGQLALIEVQGDTAIPQVLQLNSDALEIRLAWQEGSLIFESEPLRDVLAEFSRYNATQFELEDAQLAEVRIGGYIDAGDIEGLLGTLRDNFQIEAERVSDTRVILRQQE